MGFSLNKNHPASWGYPGYPRSRPKRRAFSSSLSAMIWKCSWRRSGVIWHYEIGPWLPWPSQSGSMCHGFEVQHLSDSASIGWNMLRPCKNHVWTRVGIQKGTKVEGPSRIRQHVLSNVIEDGKWPAFHVIIILLRLLTIVTSFSFSKHLETQFLLVCDASFVAEAMYIEYCRLPSFWFSV